MAKAADNTTVKVYELFREEGAYGFREIEIPKDILNKHGKETERSNPDIFAIFLMQMRKKAQNAFGI